jgi:hypothetical protein
MHAPYFQDLMSYIYLLQQYNLISSRPTLYRMSTKYVSNSLKQRLQLFLQKSKNVCLRYHFESRFQAFGRKFHEPETTKINVICAETKIDSPVLMH